MRDRKHGGREYPGGHMFYARPDSQAALLKDVKALYGAK